MSSMAQDMFPPFDLYKYAVSDQVSTQVGVPLDRALQLEDWIRQRKRLSRLASYERCGPTNLLGDSSSHLAREFEQFRNPVEPSPGIVVVDQPDAQHPTNNTRASLRLKDLTVEKKQQQKLKRASQRRMPRRSA